jgi:hypothetical protein
MSQIKNVLENVKSPVQVEKKNITPNTEQPKTDTPIVLPEAQPKKILTEKQKAAVIKMQEGLKKKREALKNNQPLPTDVKEYNKDPVPIIPSSFNSKIKKMDDIAEMIRKLDLYEKMKKETMKVELPEKEEELSKAQEPPKSQDYEKKEEIPVKELPPPPTEIETKKPEVNEPFKGRHTVKSGIVKPEFRLSRAVGKDNPFRR